MNESQRARALRLATALDCFEGWRDVKDAAGLLRELAAEPYKRTEQDAFEDWLEKECPSGDVSEVRRMWEASDALADFLAESRQAESRQAEPERVPLTNEMMADYLEHIAAAIEDHSPESLRHLAWRLRNGEG